jgi:hypothetical protein
VSNSRGGTVAINRYRACVEAGVDPVGVNQGGHGNSYSFANSALLGGVRELDKIRPRCKHAED